MNSYRQPYSNDYGCDIFDFDYSNYQPPEFNPYPPPDYSACPPPGMRLPYPPPPPQNLMYPLPPPPPPPYMGPDPRFVFRSDKVIKQQDFRQQQPYDARTGANPATKESGPNGSSPMTSIYPSGHAPFRGNFREKPGGSRQFTFSSSGDRPKRNLDFTDDSLEGDNFISFDEDPRPSKKQAKTEDQTTDPASESINVPALKAKRARVVLKLMSDQPVNKNPVSAIHELHPDAKWEFLVTFASPGSRMADNFKMKLYIINQEFIGEGRTKKLAKAAAAKKALIELYNIDIETTSTPAESTIEIMGLPKPKVSITAAEEPLLLKQDLADRIGRAVMAKAEEVLGMIPDTRKWNVLSGYVATSDMDPNYCEVLALTTGTKCIKGDSLSMIGCAINDCHAEILGRRAFMHHLYANINLLMNSNYQDRQDVIVERREDGYGLRVKSHVKIHLFISSAPCGDCRVFAPKEEFAELPDNHPNRQSRGVLRAKIEGGEGTIPVKRDSATLTWDGVLQGVQRLQFMSCSDKVAMWNVVGIQGALLSHIIEPIYLESIVLGSLFNYEHLVRGIHGRLNLNFDSHSLKSLPPMYKINKSKVAKSNLKDDIIRQLCKTPGYAVNWIKGDAKPEVINTENGKLHVDGSVSRCAKRSLFGQFSVLLGRSVVTLPNCPLGTTIPLVYRDAKTAAMDYQRAKTQAIQAFNEQNLGSWIQVPTEIDLFGL